jgi:hypothetical protein
MTALAMKSSLGRSPEPGYMNTLPALELRMYASPGSLFGSSETSRISSRYRLGTAASAFATSSMLWCLRPAGAGLTVTGNLFPSSSISYFFRPSGSVVGAEMV